MEHHRHHDFCRSSGTLSISSKKSSLIPRSSRSTLRNSSTSNISSISSRRPSKSSLDDLAYTTALPSGNGLASTGTQTVNTLSKRTRCSSLSAIANRPKFFSQVESEPSSPPPALGRVLHQFPVLSRAGSPFELEEIIVRGKDAKLEQDLGFNQAASASAPGKSIEGDVIKANSEARSVSGSVRKKMFKDKQLGNIESNLSTFGSEKSESGEKASIRDLSTLISHEYYPDLYPRFSQLNSLSLLHQGQHLFELERRLKDLEDEEPERGKEHTDYRGAEEEILESPPVSKSKNSIISGFSKASKVSSFRSNFIGFGPEELVDGAQFRFSAGCKSVRSSVEGNSGLEVPLSLRRCIIMRELEEALKNYNEAVLKYTQIANLPTARNRDICVLRTWINSHSNSERLDSHPTLSFLREGSNDVVALAARNENIIDRLLRSRLHRFLESKQMWRRLFPTIHGSLSDVKPTIQSQDTLQVFGILIMLAATLLIMMPVIIMYYLNDDLGHLAFIFVCKLGFMAVMYVCTDATKREILIGAMGYATVLVVVVGSGAFHGKGSRNGDESGR
ncbi:hypothetical protein RUND412_003532 [Rhizina undulata]